MYSTKLNYKSILIRYRFSEDLNTYNALKENVQARISKHYEQKDEENDDDDDDQQNNPHLVQTIKYELVDNDGNDIIDVKCDDDVILMIADYSENNAGDIIINAIMPRINNNNINQNANQRQNNNPYGYDINKSIKAKIISKSVTEASITYNGDGTLNLAKFR
eukprot:139830_1